jgi:hypothetical protein
MSFCCEKSYDKYKNSTIPFLKEEDMHLFLDNNHDYFYQIQGQLFCTVIQMNICYTPCKTIFAEQHF